MKFAEALKTVLCDSEKGIDYDKTVVGKDFELTFGSYTCADCSIECVIYYSLPNNNYKLGEIPVENMYCKNEYVSEKNLNEFLEKEYLFGNEEVEIK